MKVKKEQEFYKSAVKVTATISYVDKAHKEKGIQEKEICVLQSDFNENEMSGFFDSVLDENERFIDCEKMTVETVKVWFTFSQLLAVGRVEIVETGK